MPFFRTVVQLVVPPRYVTVTFPPAETTDPMPWWYPHEIEYEVDRPSSVATREEMKLTLNPKKQRGRINRFLRVRQARSCRKKHRGRTHVAVVLVKREEGKS